MILSTAFLSRVYNGYRCDREQRPNGGIASPGGGQKVRNPNPVHSCEVPSRSEGSKLMA